MGVEVRLVSGELLCCIVHITTATVRNWIQNVVNIWRRSSVHWLRWAIVRTRRTGWGQDRLGRVEQRFGGSVPSLRGVEQWLRRSICRCRRRLVQVLGILVNHWDVDMLLAQVLHIHLTLLVIHGLLHHSVGDVAPAVRSDDAGYTTHRAYLRSSEGRHCWVGTSFMVTLQAWSCLVRHSGLITVRIFVTSTSLHWVSVISWRKEQTKYS